ncbi:hypothetical protein HMPREF9162_1162 [Selenomonas sp. oral taxon 137 str. F0430]|nr:hypothetical protein HMPREF9162_1162 [Selenomonas sp. oral taxon 137 str. F0430]
MAPHVKSICNIYGSIFKKYFLSGVKNVSSYHIFMKEGRKYRCGVFWG